MTVTQRDINSAYPWACTLLPCLVHGNWYKARTQPINGNYYVGRYRFRHDLRSTLCHFPVRNRSGNICFPMAGQGWYWSPEVEAAQRAGADVELVGHAWVLETTCACRPFWFVPNLYAERKRLGKSGRGLALKLGLNSLYGKLAQSVGRAPWANPVWAGLITSLVRARLIDDYMRIGPDKCLMLATDGVFYHKDGDGYDVGTDLGQWDETIHTNGMFIIQPGLYFVSSEMGKPKTRGVPQARIVEQRTDFEFAWSRYLADSSDPIVQVDLHAFTGLRLANARGRYETAGNWVDTPKHVAFQWDTKREPGHETDRHGNVRTRPRPGGPYVETIPYSKMIGGTEYDMDSLLIDDAPDWAETFVPGRFE